MVKDRKDDKEKNPVKASVEFEKKVFRYEYDRVVDTKSIFLHFLHNEMAYHASSLQQLAKVYEEVNDQEPKGDILSFISSYTLSLKEDDMAKEYNIVKGVTDRKKLEATKYMASNDQGISARGLGMSGQVGAGVGVGLGVQNQNTVATSVLVGSGGNIGGGASSNNGGGTSARGVGGNLGVGVGSVGAGVGGGVGISQSVGISSQNNAGAGVGAASGVEAGAGVGAGAGASIQVGAPSIGISSKNNNAGISANSQMAISASVNR